MVSINIEVLAPITGVISLVLAYIAMKKRHPFTLLGWVVLPDHLHMLWRLPPDDSDYSTRIGSQRSPDGAKRNPG